MPLNGPCEVTGRRHSSVTVAAQLT